MQKKVKNPARKIKKNVHACAVEIGSVCADKKCTRMRSIINSACAAEYPSDAQYNLFNLRSRIIL